MKACKNLKNFVCDSSIRTAMYPFYPLNSSQSDNFKNGRIQKRCLRMVCLYQALIHTTQFASNSWGLKDTVRAVLPLSNHCPCSTVYNHIHTLNWDSSSSPIVCGWSSESLVSAPLRMSSMSISYKKHTIT